MTHEHGGHGPSLEQMVLEESAAGVSFSQEMANAIDHAHVTAGKDGKVDVAEFINHLLHESKALSAKYFKAEDPRAAPSYEAIQNVLETTKGAFQNGHLTAQGKQALQGLYDQHIANYIEEKGITRYQSVSPEDAKKAAKALADRVSDKFLGPLIDGAKTAAEVAARVRTSINNAYNKARQYAQTHGNVEGFVPAYAGAGHSGH